jgi:hypothetical protein
MTMQRAIQLLGVNRRRDGDLRNMVRALGLMPWLNTSHDNERREAAQYVLKRWRAYQEACNRARDIRRAI